MTPAAEVADRQMTAEEFAAEYDDAPYELVRGKVVPVAMPASNLHGTICGRFARHLGNYLADHDLGDVCTNDVFVVVGRDPDAVRGADIAYWPKDRLPGGVPSAGLVYDPPVLCAEVVSPSNTWSDIHTKTAEYHAAGVPVVVVLDPDTRTATAYRPLNGSGDDGGREFKVGEELTLPDVLPGFSVPVARLFG